ncbi:hypothetical protein [Kaistella jeonii]|nr:hypothetical protein [Kaistella jeonii]
MVRLLSFCYLPLLILMGSCNVQTAVPNNSGSIPKGVAPENSIVYLFFGIEKTPSGSEKVTHTETRITKGIIKNTSIDNKENKAGNLLITMLGKGGEVLEERIIEDPLNPVLEVFAEDGLSKNKVNLSKAEFSVRFNQKGEISSVKIEKITTTSKNNLITLKL